MWRRVRVLGACGCVLLVGTALSAAPPPLPRDTEAKLLHKLQGEHKPEKRAKLEVKLGKLKLREAFKAYKQGNLQVCLGLLDAYLERMESAWATLVASGRPATRKPQGYKELEIALRESRRRLVDFESRISYDQRQRVEKIRLETVRLHDRVLDALFPGMVPKKKKPRKPGPKAPATKEQP